MKSTVIFSSIYLSGSLLIGGQPAVKNGAVYGTVMNISQDSVFVEEQEVILYQYVNGQEVQDFKMQTVTNEGGRFIFEGLEVGENVTYYPLSMYKGVEYSGVLVKPDSSFLRQKSDLFLSEPTSSDSAISVIMHHLIIEPGNSFLNVREILFFTNRSNYTYVGNIQAAPGKNIVLRMEAPMNATELQLSGDIMSCCAVINGNQIFDTMEFKPGTRQIVLNYTLPYKGKEANLTKTIEHPTEAFDIFSLALQLSLFTVGKEGEDSEIISLEQLEEREPFQIRGKKYRRYDVGPLQQGSSFSLTISDLSAATVDYRWLAPVILILIIIIGYISNRQ